MNFKKKTAKNLHLLQDLLVTRVKGEQVQMVWSLYKNDEWENYERLTWEGQED